MAELIQIEAFLERSASIPVIDVRSPTEFRRGHIPGAVNIPLFDDHERAIVGTKYKQVNKEAAVYAGLEFAGKKLVDLVKEGEKKAGKGKALLVHCWRGGMRSKSMAWIFETIGITCQLLEGGYKSYRRYVRGIFSIPYSLKVIGGRTGSGKTAILHQLHSEGEQVLDLEAIAHHKGSAFGALGEPEQPSTEQFENELSRDLTRLDPKRIIWVEDESRNVGKCAIPGELYERMRTGETYFLDIPREERARYLVKQYADHDQEELKACVQRIHKRLGGDRTKLAIESIARNDHYSTAMIALQYYDKAYMHSLQKNHTSYRVIRAETVDPVINAGMLMQRSNQGMAAL
jgi:tRNA 2-selenouridine synthase